MSKRIVHYRENRGFKPWNNRVMLYPIDHPDSARVSNTRGVITSPVVRIEEDGTIETMNTIYKPVSVT